MIVAWTEVDPACAAEIVMVVIVSAMHGTLLNS
jgi:hypothetical protein